MAALRAGKTRSGSHQRFVMALADSSVNVPVGSMTWTPRSAAGAIWPIFSSRVMRESRSATRSSIGRAGFLYFGVSSAAAGLDVLSGAGEGLVDFFCADSEIEESRVRQRIERRRISFFFI